MITQNITENIAPDATLGDQELEVLQFVSHRAPVTVREVSDEWGVPRGRARTTVLTMMERLRKKGYLLRDGADGDGSYKYRPAVAPQTVLHNLVRDFVQKTLGGSVTPFVAYLADTPDGLSANEVAELRRLVDDMEK
ncbi:MAG: BlaI/MecI/CopY family transcriptional regulator [Armatimonadetes bacterium]|nr:BlaI/MecI/CopY family transcriptional regulator [Armatimonadota bacterium]